MSLCPPAALPSPELVHAPGSTASDEPLDAVHYQQLREAEHRAGRVRRAAGIARFNGWLTAIAAVLSAPFALFSVGGLLITVVLSVIAWIEFRGRQRLLMFEPQSTRLLGWNQVALMAFIVGYCGVTGYHQWTSDSLLTQLGSRAELESALGSLEPLEQLERRLILAVYGTLALVGMAFQGGNALYYFSRRKHVERFRAETPEWILKTLATRAEACGNA